jgi:hypothetical protein
MEIHLNISFSKVLTVPQHLLYTIGNAMARNAYWYSRLLARLKRAAEIT